MEYYAATFWVYREMEKPLSITLGKKHRVKKNTCIKISSKWKIHIEDQADRGKCLGIPRSKVILSLLLQTLNLLGNSPEISRALCFSWGEIGKKKRSGWLFNSQAAAANSNLRCHSRLSYIYKEPTIVNHHHLQNENMCGLHLLDNLTDIVSLV